MNTNNIYISKKTGKIFPLTEDGTKIDTENPLDQEIAERLFYRNSEKWEMEGENNMFKVYIPKE